MGNLNVKLIVYPNCKLSAIDDSSYTDLPDKYGTIFKSIADYVSLEFLTYSDSKEIEPNTIIFENYCHNRDNYLKDGIFPIMKDGIHFYYKIVVPKLETLFIQNSEGLYTKVFLENQTFYYNNKFYIGKVDYNTDPVTKRELLEKINEILETSKSEIITNYTELYELSGSQSFVCKKIVFTTCKLTQCLVNLQRKIIDYQIYNKCADYKKITEERDFLISTIYVLDYLKDIGNFQEAQRIIENVMECGSICDFEDDINSCGCNG
jgi:hypothetical protein